MTAWYERPLDQRAKPGGELGLNGKFYLGGEIMPFYVPRKEMPQVDEEDLPELMKFLQGLPVPVDLKKFDPDQLKPHQKVDIDKVKAMTAKAAILAKPCLVSQDLYILDGNHRWWAHRELHTVVPAFVIGAPFEQAIGILFRFPKTYSYETWPDTRIRV